MQLNVQSILRYGNNELIIPFLKLYDIPSDLLDFKIFLTSFNKFELNKNFWVLSFH